MSYLFTSEAVTAGHPDKLCDQIADAILTTCLSEDKESHVACEVCTTTGTVILMGEITTKANLNYKEIARKVIREIGYTNPEYGIDASSCSVVDLIEKQSNEINFAVNNSLETRDSSIKLDDKYDSQGAGDQGIIFGYACSETKELMPLSLILAHRLARKLESVRPSSNILRPDGKTQVTVKYDDLGKINCIDTILISTQHNPGFTIEFIRDYVKREIIDPVIISDDCYMYITNETKFIINPSGSFTVGGPQGDTGLTGRKLAVDTYGGHAKFGGGALCGKDPSKVDRSAAYMSRYIAKHLVASEVCSEAEVQLSYGIGIARPISVNVKVDRASSKLMTEIVNEVFDMRPAAVIDSLKLKDFDYTKLSGQCQFGNDSAPWEIINPDIVYGIRESIKKYKEPATN